MFAAVAGLHVLGWALLTTGTANTATTITVGTGILAYTLGLRHAFDADHIAAIDNTTRKLINDGQRPATVGLFFSLGHSSVVFLATLLVALGMTAIGDQLADENSPLRTAGAAIGGTVAGLFLLTIAALNIKALASAVRNWRGNAATSGHHPDGLLTRLFAPVARTIDKPWKMYPLGLLFGLGFDTASTITLMALTGTSAVAGGNFLAMLALPVLFTAGMSLGDSVDGLLMNKAYQWSAGQPRRQLAYSMTVTSISIIAALAIALPVLAGVAADTFGATDPIITALSAVDLEYVGFALVALFMSVWIVAAIAWRSRRPDTETASPQ